VAVHRLASVTADYAAVTAAVRTMPISAIAQVLKVCAREELINLQLDGKRVLIMGSGSGLGEGIASLLP